MKIIEYHSCGIGILDFSFNFIHVKIKECYLDFFEVLFSNIKIGFVKLMCIFYRKESKPSFLINLI